MFAVGDKVVCVDAEGRGSCDRVVLGAEYVVLDADSALNDAHIHVEGVLGYWCPERFVLSPAVRCDAVLEEDCVCATVPPPPERVAFQAVAAEHNVPAGWHLQAPDSEGWVEYISDTGLVVTKTLDGFFAAHLGQGGVRRDTFEEAATDAVDDALADTGCPTPGSCVDCNPTPVVNPKTSQGAAKPNLALVLDTACLQEAVAMMSGAEKYGAFNWRESTVPAMTYVAAMRRHLALWLNGEDGETDPKTGYYVTHLGAVRANAAILIDAQAVGTLVDDRPPPTLALRYTMTRNLKEAP